MSMHLDEKRLHQLLEGELSHAEEQRLHRHLREECPQCEAFLESLDEGRAGLLLAVLARTRRPPDLSIQAQREVMEQGAPRRFGLSHLLLPVAGLTLLLLVGLAFTLAHVMGSDTAESSRVKGDTVAAPAVDLAIGRISAGARERIVRVRAEEILEPHDRVVFRVSTEGSCLVYLVRIDEGSLEVLVPLPGEKPVRHPGGSFTPSMKGRPAAMNLSGLNGRQHFAALCATQPLDLPEDLDTLVGVLRAGQEPAGSDDVVSYDVVTITVGPKDDTP
jgi:hypothetical protein